MRPLLPACLAALLAAGGCGDDDAPADDERDASAVAPGPRGERDASAPDAARALDASLRDAAPAERKDAAGDARPEVDAGSLADASTDAARAPGDASIAVDPSVVAIDAPPTYLGTNANDPACSKSYRTVGFAPQAAGKHPLFLYFVGTRFLADDQSADYASQAAKAVAEAMARRGFVALSVEYDNGFGSFLVDKSACLYTGAKSVLASACALPNVDCSAGIATWGHSQGALIAHQAANHDDRVRAVWTTGYSGLDGARLPANRLRVVNGEADTLNASFATLNKAAGFQASECKDGADECLRADGSGWMIVRKAQSATNSADHCWFDKRACPETTLSLEPNWLDRASNQKFALEANADWVASTVRR